MTPFAVDIPDEQISDLYRRLRATRWPVEIPVEGWSAGAQPAAVKRLARYWADGFDWRAQEAQINTFPQFTVPIGGAQVHYIHLRGEGERAFPLVLTHGWPGSFLEMTRLAERLARPSRYGGAPQDAFDVVIPSLPGFTFSHQRPQPHDETHELWHTLMREVLGYRTYGAHGGDLGAGVTSRLGAAHPESVAGIHLLAVADPPVAAQTHLTLEEQAHLAQRQEWNAQEGGYQHQQQTRPVTLAYGLSDSPAGLLAWVTEKYRAWSDCGDELATRFSDDDILTQASLYWFTNTIGSSFRPYYEYHRGRPHAWRRVEVPTAVAVFPHDLAQPPRSWAERTYNVTRYTTMPQGGHFAAHEEPQLLADDLTAFFKALR